MPNTTILFTSGFPTEDMQKQLTASGYRLLYGNEKSAPDFDLSNVEVLVCYNPFPCLDIDQMPALKWIHLVSKGINHVPVKKIQAHHILVTNTVQSTSIPISEWIVTQILCLYKQMPLFLSQQADRKYLLCSDILELYHKKVLFLGTGYIAKEAAKRLDGFNMQIDGMNRSGHPAGDMFDSCYPMAELEERLPGYDILVSALPATADTLHLLDEKMLSRLKKSAVLINISRGSIVDTEALCRLLQQQKLRGAALDVFETEPLPSDSPLWDTPNLIITPHNSYLSEYYSARNLTEVFDNLMRYSKKEPLKNPVDFGKGY